MSIKESSEPTYVLWKAKSTLTKLVLKTVAFEKKESLLGLVLRKY